MSDNFICKHIESAQVKCDDCGKWMCIDCYNEHIKTDYHKSNIMNYMEMEYPLLIKLKKNIKRDLHFIEPNAQQTLVNLFDYIQILEEEINYLRKN